MHYTVCSLDHGDREDQLLWFDQIAYEHLVLEQCFILLSSRYMCLGILSDRLFMKINRRKKSKKSCSVEAASQLHFKYNQGILLEGCYGSSVSLWLGHVLIMFIYKITLLVTCSFFLIVFLPHHLGGLRLYFNTLLKKQKYACNLRARKENKSSVDTCDTEAKNISLGKYRFPSLGHRSFNLRCF